MANVLVTTFCNHILARIPAKEFNALQDHLHLVTLNSGQVLHEPDQPITDVFFLEQGVVATAAQTQDAGQVEVGLIGREGLVGASAILNSLPVSAHRTFVQAPGLGHRINASVLRSAIDGAPHLRYLCLRYIDFWIIQSSQAAACNARHTVQERMARWLLMVQDRLERDDLALTHEFLGVMLGISRSQIAKVITYFKENGTIRQTRGHIIVANRERLAKASCDCYWLIRRNQNRVLGDGDSV